MRNPTGGDELMLLRAADPVDVAALPSARDAEAHALFEAITGSAVPDAATDRRSRPLLLAAAAVVVVFAVTAGVVSLARNNTDEPPDEIVQSQPTPQRTSGAISPGPLTPGGSVGSCVELYDLSTLTNREVAFDGTVEQVRGDRVTFTVREWFRGGDATEITLAGASTLTGLTSAGPTASLEPGARLLVAGDGGFAWSCGFTQPYDPAVAREWKAALSG